MVASPLALVQLVEDPAVDDVVSWNEDGSAFVVWRPAEFGRDLLPQYFKHSNFSSFVRQLNTYGFRKIAPDRWEFANDCFRRGEKRLLCDIQRRKVAQAAAIPVSPTNSAEEQVLSSSSWPGSAVGDLAVENERLRRENAWLSREVARMKGLCNDVLLLISEYAAGRGHASIALAAEPATAPETVPPQEASEEVTHTLAPSGGAKLFGVHIGAKRLRTEDRGDRPDRMETESELFDAFTFLERQRRWLSLYTGVCKS